MDDEIRNYRSHKSVKKLLTTRDIEEYWSAKPSKHSIHVIVELPAKVTSKQDNSPPSSIEDEISSRLKKLDITPSSKRPYSENTNYEGADEYAFISEKRLEIIDQKLSEGRICLLRSPPCSGKTTLVSLFGEYLKSHYPDRTVVTISMLWVRDIQKRLTNPALFDEFWIEQTGNSWSHYIACDTPTDIIMDEAQILYPYASDFFWNVMKGFLDQKQKTTCVLRVLLLSMYGEPNLSGAISTPIKFEITLGLEDLRLTTNEYETFLENLVHTVQSTMPFQLSDQVKRVVYNISKGHAGIIRTTINKLIGQYRYYGKQSEGDVLKYLISDDFRNYMRYTRSFFWLNNWNPSEKESKFLRNALNKCDKDSTFKVDMDIPENVNILEKYIHSGLIVKTEKGTQITAPLMRSTLTIHLYKVPYEKRVQLSDENSFEEFLLRSLERMSASTLKQSLSRSTTSADGRLVEQMWQKEWYRAANTVLPRDVSISSDVGWIYGSDAYLDFYINGELQWGIEILREGLNMKEHSSRFEPNDDFTTFTVKRPGKKDEKIVLRGDLA